MPPAKHDFTLILHAANNGDEAAGKEVWGLLCDELRLVAREMLRKERSEFTLSTTTLVREAYLRLVDQETVQVDDKEHFMSLAAGAMRRILVDHLVFERRSAPGCRVSTDSKQVFCPPRNSMERTTPDTPREFQIGAACLRHRPFLGYTTKKVGHGTGLGLSISYGIIQDCQGTIHAVPNADGGASFIIAFPILDES